MMKNLLPTALRVLAALVAISPSLFPQSSDILWIRGGHPTPVTSLAASADGALLAAADAGGRVLVRESASGFVTQTFTFTPREGQSFAMFRSDDRIDLILAQTGEVLVWQIGVGAVRRFPVHPVSLAGAFLLPGDERIALVGRDGVMRSYNVLDGDSIGEVDLGTEDVSSAYLLAGGSIVANVGYDRVVRPWDLAAGAPLPSFPLWTYSSDILAVTPRKALALAPVTSGTLGLWDVRTGTVADTIRIIEDHAPFYLRNPIASAAFSADEDSIVLHSDLTGEVLLWDVKTDTILKSFDDGFPYGDAGVQVDNPGMHISKSWISLAPDGRNLLLSTYQNVMDDVALRSDLYMAKYEMSPSFEVLERVDFTPLPAGVHDVAVSRDGRTAAIAAHPMLMSVEIPTGTYTGISHVMAPAFGFCGIAPDAGASITFGTVISIRFGGGAVSTAIVTNMEGGLRLPRKDIIIAPREVAVSPAGRFALVETYLYSSSSSYIKLPIPFYSSATFSYDTVRLSLPRVDTAFIWNCVDEKIEHAIVTDTVIRTTGFSRDGSMLACGLDNGGIVIYDVASGAEVARLSGHDGPVLGVAFARQGRFLVSSGGDSTIRTWNVATRVNDYTYREYPGVSTAVDATPDGRYILSGTSDGAVVLWQGRGDIAKVRDDAEEPIRFEVRPNPVSGSELVVALGGHAGSIELVDVLGNVVTSKPAEGADAVTMSVAGLAPGYYICRLVGRGRCVSRPVLIVR